MNNIDQLRHVRVEVNEALRRARLLNKAISRKRQVVRKEHAYQQAIIDALWKRLSDARREIKRLLVEVA